MKKVFLLLAAVFGGFAAMAQFTYNATTGVIEVPYNSYGKDRDATPDGKSDQWQGGNRSVLDDAVFAVTSEAWGLPAIGETFQVTIKGTSNYTGKLKVFLVDQRVEGGYFTKLSDANGEFDVVKDVPFEAVTVLVVTNNSLSTNGGGTYAVGQEIPGGLTAADLVLGCEPTATSGVDPTYGVDPAFTSASNLTITTTEFKVKWEAARAITNGYPLTSKGPADKPEDGFKYQGQSKAAGVTVAAGATFVNVQVSGKAEDNITTLMYSLVDASADAQPKAYFSDVVEGGFATFASNIAKDSVFSFEFSLPVSSTYVKGATSDYQNVFLAQDQADILNLYMSNVVVNVSVGDTKLYADPNPGTAVNNINAAAFAVENGVVTSAGQIVVYNVAGQVVATASQSFNVSSLSNGVYFITAQEGTIKFVK